MTLLVLDLHIPSAAQAHSEDEWLWALGALGPQWIAYGMSFLTLGILWAGQQTQLNHIAEGTRDLTWIHLGFLFTITFLPLSTRLLAGGVYPFPAGAGRLLAEPVFGWVGAVRELEICAAGAATWVRILS